MKVRKKLSGLIAVLMGMAILFGSTMVTQAAGESGIAGNGTGGISIDINAYPYTYYASLPWGQYAYTESGCAWFATSRACQITGTKYASIYSGATWYNSAYANYGLQRGNTIREKALACYSNHVSVIEKVEGNTAIISEGGYSTSGAAHGYTVIRTRKISDIESKAEGYLGYVYLTNSPSTEVSLSFSADRCEPDQSNVFVYTEANTNVSGSFTEAGVTLWDENNQVVVKKSEATSVSGTKLKIYYNITNETGVVLQSGTNYKYQLYTVFNGKRYETTVKTFKTLGQASNAWTSDLTMEDWTYGETAKIPSISAKYGNVVYTYSTEKNGNYSANKPKDAGTYYVKATVVATEEYTGLETVKEFHIRKAVPSYDMPQGIKAVYGQKLSEVQLPSGFVWADATEVVGNVGEKTFVASFVPEDTKNYATVENLKIAVTVEPKDMSGTKLTGIDKNTDLSRYEIKDGDTVLVKEQDYMIDVVKANDKVTVKVTFKGNYTGKTETTYSVKNAAANAKDGQKNTTQATDKTNTKNKAAKTGDHTAAEVLVMLVVLAGAAIVVVGKKRFAK